jgi:hypothetical protein
MEGTATVSDAPAYGSGATLQYNRSTNQAAGPEWVSPFAATGGEYLNTGIVTVSKNHLMQDRL